MKIILQITRKNNTHHLYTLPNSTPFRSSMLGASTTASLYDIYGHGMPRADASLNKYAIESNVRTALSSVSHLIWIESITINDNNCFDMDAHSYPKDAIIVTCKPQGSTIENLELKEIVNQALRMRGDLNVIDIKIQETMMIPAIKECDDHIYKANIYFSDYLARNDKYRSKMINDPVTEASVEYVEAHQKTFRTTGKICTTTAPNNAQDGFDPANIYNCYAFMLDESEELRNEIINSNILEILLIHNEDYQLSVNIKKTVKYSFNYKSLKPQEEENLAPVITETNESANNKSEDDANITASHIFANVVTKLVPGNVTVKSIEKALRIAASQNNVDDLKIIAERCENINAQDETPSKLYTALHWSVKSNAVDATRYLLSLTDIDKHIKNAQDMTPTDLAKDSSDEIKQLFGITLENNLQHNMKK